MTAGAVRTERDAEPVQREGDILVLRELVASAHYAEPLTCRSLRSPAGRSLPRRELHADELLYVTYGEGSLTVDGAPYSLATGTAALVLAGEQWSVTVAAGAELRLVSVLVPAPPGPAAASLAREASQLTRTAVLGAQARREATADRAFEVLFDTERGCRGATQFVGFIPPSGAPEHYHLYDEICVILRGQGVLHTLGTAQPIAAGSAFSVPPRLLHSLENTGQDDLWVLGVFRPAGSASAAYYPDGQPAPGHDEG